MITSVDEFVDEMGGRTAASTFFGVRPNAISMWQARGFPAWAAMRALEFAQKNKMVVDTRVFATRRISPKRPSKNGKKRATRN